MATYKAVMKSFCCLMKKIESYRISGETLSWISEFIHERRQKVVINGESSAWNDVNSGVHQGSFLVPVLFVLFINVRTILAFDLTTDCLPLK